MSQNTKLRVVESADPTPFDFQTEVYQRGLKHEKPPLTFDSTRWASLAHEKLNDDAWGYVHGSAGKSETDDNNLSAFRKWGLVPNRLVPANFPDLSVSIFGKEYAYPIAIAPVGVQKIFHEDGESAVAAAAAAEHVPYIMSTAASTSIEDAAKANGSGHRWYQLYWPSNQHDNITASILRRAQASGFDVLVVTLDTYILGWRPSDLDNGYNPFLRADNIGVEIGFSDPEYRKLFMEKYGKEIEEDLATAAGTWAKIIFPGFSHGWEDLKFLRQHWSGPIVLKGIQTVRDARKAIEMGMDGIIVSNHGGRQVDGCIASLDVLPEIADAVGEELEVIFDSGVRSGTDVLKALALGAKMVCIGRPYVYGLALAGEAG